MIKLAGMRLTPDMMRDYSLDYQVNSGMIMSDNFELNSFLGQKVSGKTMVYLSMMYTGSDVVSNSAGNIADVVGPILPPGWRPSETYTGWFDRAGVSRGSVTITSAGLITLKTMSNGATLTFGNNIAMSVGWLSQNN